MSHDTAAKTSRARVSPRLLAALLLVLIAANAVFLAWRWASAAELPPGDYYSYQIREWEVRARENPEDPVVWATLGGLYENSGDEQEAASSYAKALALDPDNVAALIFIARQEQEDGQYDEARERLERVVEVLPEGRSALALYELGRLEESIGDREAALKAYRDSVAQQGTYWNAYFRIAVLEEDAGNLGEALEAAEAAARFAPDDEVVQQVVERIRASARDAGIESPTGAGDD